MGDNIREIVIDTFAGGMSDGPRVQTDKQFDFARGFDIWRDPNALRPMLDFEDNSTMSSADDLLAFEFTDFYFDAGVPILYALGDKGSTAHPKLFSNTNLASGTWSAMTTAEGSQAQIPGTFFKWANHLWMFSGSVDLSKYNLNTNVFTDATTTLANGIARGAGHIISPSDNCAYAFYYGGTSGDQSYVVRVNSSGTVSDNVLPLPKGYRICGSALWGNYIAIAMTTPIQTGVLASSIVVLWDPTLSNFSEIIDFGSGEIRAFGNLEGSLVAMMYMGATSTSLTIAGGSIQIKTWGGGAVDVAKHLQMDGSIFVNGSPMIKTVVRDNSMYFSAQVNRGGTRYGGIWRFGRKKAGLPFGLSLQYYSPMFVSTSDILTFELANEYVYLVRNDDRIYKTNNESAYTEAAVLESQKYTDGDIARRKKLHSVFLTTAPLPADGQIVFKYRKDEETAYTTLFTETADNNVLTERGAGSDIALPEYKEIQFQIESTGGAVVTSWGFRYTVLDGATTPDMN